MEILNIRIVVKTNFIYLFITKLMNTGVKGDVL